MKIKLYILVVLLCVTLSLSSCGSLDSQQKKLPPPQADTTTMFSVDQNINMTTIDEYVGRSDVVYRDVRMLFDPANYGAIGGEADLTKTITGFKITPFPYIASLQALPVDGAYTGNTLFTVIWAEDGTVKSSKENYKESKQILDELFPKDKAIFIMCGGGGYSNMMKQLLLYYGWDEQLLYNIGANWEYNGKNVLELAIFPEDANEEKTYATWRADYAYIDFEKLHKLEQ